MSCGAELPEGARFCPSCGAASSAPSATTPPAPERTPRAYTPKHLADKILASRAALEGERKQVTVLFADVKGSLELAESVDPEQWHAILDRFFAILADGVHRFEGTVNQYTGDGIMALFGAPLAHEDHAQRACYAALHLREALRAYADELRRTRGLSLSTRIGLNSGEVVVGRIGDDLRMDYTAQGHTVGLAQRMEQLSAADSTYLTAHTARLVEGYFQLRDLGDFELKGVNAPLRVHELQGVGALRTRFDRSRARGLSRFVGRAREMATLAAALDAAWEGHGAAVGVVAHAGTGKSRLCFEFLESCRARGIAVHEGRAVAHGKHIALIPILEIFRSYFGIEADDDARRAREKIAGRLVLLDDAFRDVLPALFEFLGVAEPGQRATDPQARQYQLLGVARRLFQRATAERPAVLFIEDLHWLDSASEAWIADWVDAAAGTHTLILLNYRPEFRADWLGRSHAQQLALAPLGAEAIRELIADLLGSDPSLAQLPALILAKTGGNPFFIEEVVQALIESGALAGHRGAYRLTTALDRIDVPATVQALLAARIDRLDEREKRVLATAAVIGKNFRRELLERVLGIDAAQLDASLARLRASEFVYEQSLYPIVEYAFKHPLTQEVAYGSQLGEQRKAVHARVATALAASVPESANEHAALLAHHFELAGENFVAAQWHRRAMQHAAYSRTAALPHARKAFDLARTAQQSEARDRLMLDTGSELLFFGLWAGAGDAELTRMFEETMALANALGDGASVRSLRMRRLMNGLFGTGDITGAVAAIEAHWAEAIAAEREDVNDFPGALSLIHLLMAKPARAAEYARRSLASYQPSDAPSVFEQSRVPSHLANLAHAAIERGEIEGARRELAQLKAFAERDGRPELRIRYQLSASFLEVAAGNSEDALRFAAEYATDRDLVSIAVSLDVVASALLLAGRPRDAAAKLEELRRRAQELAFELHVPKVLAGLALAHLATGELDRAEAFATEGLTLSRQRGTLRFEPPNLIALARVRIAQRGADARDEVEELLAQAEARAAAEGGPRIHLPAIAEARAQLAAAMGDARRQRELLGDAHRLYTEMGATGHAARLAKELGL